MSAWECSDDCVKPQPKILFSFSLVRLPFPRTLKLGFKNFHCNAYIAKHPHVFVKKYLKEQVPMKRHCPIWFFSCYLLCSEFPLVGPIGQFIGPLGFLRKGTSDSYRIVYLVERAKPCTGTYSTMSFLFSFAHSFRWSESRPGLSSLFLFKDYCTHRGSSYQLINGIALVKCSAVYPSPWRCSPDSRVQCEMFV